MHLSKLSFLFGAVASTFPFALRASSVFDADSFAQTDYAESNDTELIPIDDGEYVAVAKKKDLRLVETKQGEQVVLDVTWSIDDPAQKEKTGRDNLTVRQGIFLDRTESGSLDFGKGKNVGLGKLREAIGLNQPGQPFNFTMIEGRPAIIKVTSRKDKDSDQIFNDVKGVRAVG